MMRVLKYAWFCVVMKLTGFLSEFTFFMRLRGFLLRPCFARCGRNFQIGSNVMIIYPSRLTIGHDVYIAYGSWVQGIGGVTLEDEVMLGPYTVLATANHVKVAGSYRFAHGRHAPIVLKRGSWTGSHVTITAGTTIGAGAACAAGAVVTRDVPDHGLVGGVPARLIGVEGESPVKPS